MCEGLAVEWACIVKGWYPLQFMNNIDALSNSQGRHGDRTPFIGRRKLWIRPESVMFARLQVQ